QFHEVFGQLTEQERFTLSGRSQRDELRYAGRVLQGVQLLQAALQDFCDAPDPQWSVSVPLSGTMPRSCSALWIAAEPVLSQRSYSWTVARGVEAAACTWNTSPISNNSSANSSKFSESSRKMSGPSAGSVGRCS